MARRLASFWSHVAGRTHKPALFAATVVVAAKLKDATIAATLLQPFGLAALSGKAALQLTDLLSAYGVDWCRTLFQEWESQQKNELPNDRAAWMESTLAILCRALCQTPVGRELAGWILTKHGIYTPPVTTISRYASAEDTAKRWSVCASRFYVSLKAAEPTATRLFRPVSGISQSESLEVPLQVPMASCAEPAGLRPYDA